MIAFAARDSGSPNTLQERVSRSLHYFQLESEMESWQSVPSLNWKSLCACVLASICSSAFDLKVWSTQHAAFQTLKDKKWLGAARLGRAGGGKPSQARAERQADMQQSRADEDCSEQLACAPLSWCQKKCSGLMVFLTAYVQDKDSRCHAVSNQQACSLCKKDIIRKLRMFAAIKQRASHGGWAGSASVKPVSVKCAVIALCCSRKSYRATSIVVTIPS